MSMNEIFRMVIELVAVTLLSSGILVFWLKRRIISSEENKAILIDKQRIALSQLLELLSERIARKQFDNEDWVELFAKASKEVLLWCPDNVLYHYAMYIQEFKPDGSEEQEVHFAKAILEFRKAIGYRNWFGRITTEHIAKIFRAGN